MAHLKNHTPEEIRSAIEGKLSRYFGCEVSDATDQQLYEAVASTVRDQIMEMYTPFRGERTRQKAKKLYYLCAEFLVGRTLSNNMISLGCYQAFREALDSMGVDFDKVCEQEPEPALGNGGLGRLAACFMDSLATLDLPAMGCTIRYEYGLFRQRIVDGQQVELPDNWLANGNIWEIPRPNETIEVHFGGTIEEKWEQDGLHVVHKDYKTVLAVPYDMPVLGYETPNVNMLRLWSAKSPKTLDMQQFNQGQYAQAMEERELAEVISKVLYPEDNHAAGKELRLRQHYFLAAASVGFILQDFQRTYGGRWELLPDKIAIHINDTHPGLAIPEFIRVLVDEKHLDWSFAEYLTRRVFAYTNHTVMAEALEVWNEDMLRLHLPRIHSILVELNRRLSARLWDYYPDQWQRISDMSILSYGQVHMANLCVSMSHHVNGVSKLHGEILKDTLFHNYAVMNPEDFSGITNGVTHRRWLLEANTGLASLLDETIGTGWHKDASQLSLLKPYADDAAFREAFAKVKAQNKERLAHYLKEHQGVTLRTDAVLDVQAKRMHEYKRQMLNALHILSLYNRIVEDPDFTIPPVTYVFGAKAAAGYTRAKLIIRFIHALAAKIEAHPRARTMLQVVYLENYSVSNAELLIPAAEVSEQLSTAGKEASGTGNMKFMLNGAVTIGTMDGANVEMYEQLEKKGIYIFGLSASEVEQIYRTGSYQAHELFTSAPELYKTMMTLLQGNLLPNDPRAFNDLYNSLVIGDNGNMADPYLTLRDYASYAAAHTQVISDYQKPDLWWKQAIWNTACSGFFSSDRTIQTYNERVWNMEPLKLDTYLN